MIFPSQQKTTEPKSDPMSTQTLPHTADPVIRVEGELVINDPGCKQFWKINQQASTITMVVITDC